MRNAFDCKELFHFGLIIAEGILKRRIVLVMKTTRWGRENLETKCFLWSIVCWVFAVVFIVLGKQHDGIVDSRSSGNLIKIKKQSRGYVRRNHVLNIKQLMNNKKVPFITFNARFFHLFSSLCFMSPQSKCCLCSRLMCVNNKPLQDSRRERQKRALRLNLWLKRWLFSI